MATDATPESESPGEGGDGNGRRSGHRRSEFWGMVSGIAGVLGVIATVVIGFTQCGTNPSPGVSATSIPGSVAEPAVSRSSTPTSTTSSESATIRWSGKINMTYLDLDSDPPQVLPDNSGASVTVSYKRQRATDDFPPATVKGLGGGFFTTEPTVAQWNGTTEPTREQCSELISTQGAETLPVAADSSFCVATAANRVAFMSGFTPNHTTGTYLADVIVWEATE